MAAGLVFRFWSLDGLPATATHSSGPTIEKLEVLEELVVQKVTVSDILTYTDGPVSASWLVRGDGLISVPLGRARITNRNEVLKTATIMLRAPRVLSARVDHERTAFWDSKQGLWNRLNPWGTSLDALQTQAMRAAQRLVTQAIDSPENIDHARRLASRLLIRLYAELGWTITIELAKEPESNAPSKPSLLPTATASGVNRNELELPEDLACQLWSVSDSSQGSRRLLLAD